MDLKRDPKKALIVVVLAILVGVGYYLLSPVFRDVVLDEELPENIISGEEVASGFENLSPEEQADMQKQMEEKNSAGPKTMDEHMPKATTPQGVTSPVVGTSGHRADGTVRVLETASGDVVRFENFETINGPNLHVYLATDLQATNFIDLGPIKGTQGNINYEIPQGTDLSKYKYVMHWCVPFSVLFNYAEI